jgi:hypothetical protein
MPKHHALKAYVGAEAELFATYALDEGKLHILDTLTLAGKVPSIHWMPQAGGGTKVSCIINLYTRRRYLASCSSYFTPREKVPRNPKTH